jgi:phosphoribosylformylglycinamidine synthase
LVEIINAGLVDSAHDCSDGGIATTLAESTFQKNVGVKVDLKSSELPPEFVLFGEDASRVVMSCDPNELERIKQVAGKHKISLQVIGETVSDRLEIKLDGRVIVSASISELRQVYENALADALKGDPELVGAD